MPHISPVVATSHTSVDKAARTPQHASGSILTYLPVYIHYPILISLLSLDLDELPISSRLEHVRELDPARCTPDLGTEDADGHIDHQLPVLISDGLPPVPARLVERISQGIFVEMSELLPDHLCAADTDVGDRRANKTKLTEVDNIIDWIQCFGIYIAVLSRSAPDRVADLLGYQSLIISAAQYHRAGRWVVYDRRFRLKASAKNIKIWSAIEVTIWNMVFPDYTLGSQQPGRSLPMIPANAYCPPRLPASEPRHQICLQWNENPNGCPRPSCRFEHICYRCVHNPRVSDKIHKALECPHKEKRTAPQQHQGPPALMNL